MKNYLLIVLLFIQTNSFSQNFTINPNQANRGQSLLTTITPSGAFMTTSSGFSGLYHFSLEQGSYVIPENSYTLNPSGLGFAYDAQVIFVIPYNALPGLYDVHIKHQFWSYDVVKPSAFQIYETGFGGTVYFDSNQNGVFDSTDQGLMNQMVLISPQNTTVLTESNGHYRTYLSQGTYHDSLVIPPNFTLTSPYSSYNISIPPDTTGFDFGVYTPPGLTYLHDFVSVSNRIRCNRQANVCWTVRSKSNNTQNGTVTMIKNSPLAYIGSNPAPTYIGNDTIRWSYSLVPFQTLNGVITLLGGLAGTTSDYYLIDSLFDGSGNFISTSMDSLHAQVLCSWDPNDKSVSPEGIDSINHYTLKTDELKYTIRFQNCGNDTAFDITVLDTIDNSLDMSTFHILYSSAPVITQYQNNRILRFSFNNILLPDSTTDELNSHGFIVYSIKPNANVPDFTAVRNRAYIYFDLNDAVQTNRTFNTLVSQLNVGIGDMVSSGIYSVFPNPVTGKSVLKLPGKHEYLLNVYSSEGKLVKSVTISADYSFDKNDFEQGIYYYRLTDMQSLQKHTGKFVVIK